MEKTTKERVGWIDGVRSVACVFIVMHHFLLAFYSDSYYGTDALGNPGGSIALWWSQSPVSVLTNGNFWVCVFLVISGYVLSIQCFQKAEFGKIQKMLFKRYFRIALPVLVLSFIVQLMMMTNLFTNRLVSQFTDSKWLSGYYAEVPEFKQVFLNGLIDAGFKGVNLYSNAFWMLKYVLLGGFLAYVLAIIGTNRKRYIYVFYVFVLWVFYHIAIYYCAIIVGVMLAHYMYYYGKQLPAYFNLFLFVLALFLGGYPTGVLKPTNVYGLLWGPDPGKTHIVGATLFIFAISQTPILMRLFSNGVLVRLGKISYAIFLVHIPVLFSIGCYAFLIFYRMGVNYHVTVFTTMLITYFFVFCIAYMFEKYVERNCSRLTNWIESKL